jgi:hypothetical protein
MKTKLITALCAAAILSMGLNSASAATDDDLKVAADALVVRPACFVATVVGSGLFVVSLPIAAISRSVKKTAHVLVVRPARATFTRPLGDMESLED